MKDYGVKESWNKYVVFSEGRHFLPLDIPRNGQPILGCCRGKLVTYDVGSRCFADLQLSQVPTFNLVYPYMASLISLESACGGEKMSETERMKIGGKTVSNCTYVNQLPDGAKIRVYARLGLPGGLHTSKLSYWCGCLARDGRLLPIDSTSWRKFDNAAKDRVWQMVLEKFDIDEELKHYVIQYIGKRWKDNKGTLKAKYYDNCVATEDGYAHCPPTVIPNQWQTLVNLWDSKEAKKRRESNKQNQSHQTLPDMIKTKSFSRVHHEEEASHDPPSRNDVFAQVLGPERHGCVRGYGLGVTPNSLLGSFSSHGGPSASDFTVLKNKVQQMEEQMKQNDVKISELRSMIQAIYS